MRRRVYYIGFRCGVPCSRSRFTRRLGTGCGRILGSHRCQAAFADPPLPSPRHRLHQLPAMAKTDPTGAPLLVYNVASVPIHRGNPDAPWSTGRPLPSDLAKGTRPSSSHSTTALNPTTLVSGHSRRRSAMLKTLRGFSKRRVISGGTLQS